MQVKLSKTLEGIIARTAFNAAKAGIKHALKDHFMLELLREEGSLAYQLLSERLEAWELYQLRLRIEQAVTNPADAAAPTEDPEHFFRQFANRLCAKYSGSQSVSSAHALWEVTSDPTTYTAQLLPRYRLTAEQLGEAIRRVGENPTRRPEIEVRLIDLQHESPSPKRAPQLLDRFGRDLTAAARSGAIDPVVGREREIERVVQILARRKKNNPILIGEAGVGKTAVVEGLARRIAEGTVPAALREKRLFSLDITTLVAGTKYRGEFEERMQQLLEELQRDRDTILFIDEIHTIVGAGATQGALDTANILKPALARGELQTIGATTLDEYRTHIERDSALERRFRCVMIEPTSTDATLTILRQIAPHYEAHHGVRYTDEALRACVELTDRYQSDRHFPDKAIDLLDEAGTTGGGEEVTRAHIEQVMTALTGIPIERIATQEQHRLRSLESHLTRRIIGQQEAVRSIAHAILRARAGLKEASRPIGSFLFVGPTGVGKTLLAKELANWLFDEERGLIRLDMSEYSEPHSIARLIGSPPGYVGYGEGGQLTEAVRRRPYAVVLFDEIEKAHPDLFHTLLQLLDEGHLTDGAGRKVDFRNTILVMTSNVGSREATERSVQVGYTSPSQRDQRQAATDATYRKALERTFAPELLNRIDEVVLFRPLGRQEIAAIIRLELAGLKHRARALGYTLRITAGAEERLAAMGYTERYGARALKRTLTEQIEAPMAQLIIDGKLTAGRTLRIESDRKAGVRLRIA